MKSADQLSLFSEYALAQGVLEEANENRSSDEKGEGPGEGGFCGRAEKAPAVDFSRSLFLYIGRRDTGITVCPDARHPNMWRIRHRDGRLSDIVNLARAKDAALDWALRGRGGLTNGELINWRHTREDASEAQGQPVSPRRPREPSEAHFGRGEPHADV
jgi:hypothetical protein